MGDYSARLLPAMLQGVQAKSHEIGGICDTNNAEYTALLSKFIIIKGVGRGHLVGQGGSSESVYVASSPS